MTIENRKSEQWEEEVGVKKETGNHSSKFAS